MLWLSHTSEMARAPNGESCPFSVPPLPQRNNFAPIDTHSKVTQWQTRRNASRPRSWLPPRKGYALLVVGILTSNQLTPPVLLQVAQLQKQKKKANKKASTATDTPKDAETAKEAEAVPESAAITETVPPADTPAAEKPEEDATADTATPEQPAESESQQKPSVSPQLVESPVEPMPPAPTSPDPETESQPARLDTPRAGHTRQPSLSIQSKMRSSSFRRTSISQGSAPSPAALKSPPQPLPPLTGDGDSVHEVFRKQSTKIEELEKDNKRLEKELSDATTRWRKTEDQLEDLREASVDGAELRERLKQAEEKVASIEALVCCIEIEFQGRSTDVDNRKRRSRCYNGKTHSFSPGHIATTQASLCQGRRNRRQQISCAN